MTKHYDNLKLEVDARRGDNLVPRAFNDWTESQAPSELVSHNNPFDWNVVAATSWGVDFAGEERIGNRYRKLRVTGSNVGGASYGVPILRSDRLPVEPNTTYYQPRVVVTGTGADTLAVRVRVLTSGTYVYDRGTELTPYEWGANTFTTGASDDHLYVELQSFDDTPSTIDVYVYITGIIQVDPIDHNGWNTDSTTHYVRDWSSTSVDTDYRLFGSASGYMESDAHACTAGQYAFGGAVGLSEQEGIVWYDSDMQELSVSRYDMETGSPQVAPANTAYAALRLYHTGADSIGPTFFLIGDTSAEVEAPQDVYNDYVNPAYGLGDEVARPYGWKVPTNYRVQRTDIWRGLYFEGLEGRDDWFESTPMPVVPNTYTTLTMEALHDDSGTDYGPRYNEDDEALEVHIDLKYFDKDGNEVTSSSAPSGNITSSDRVVTGWKQLCITNLTPANAATAVWYHRPRGSSDTTPTTNTGSGDYRPHPGYHLRNIVMASNLYIDDAVGVRDDYTAMQHDWLDVLADATEISFEREGIISGFMNATIKGDDFDPAKVDYVRPGRDIRVAVGDTVLYQGTVTDASTRYGSETMVYVNASNIAERLGNIQERRSVAKLQDLSLILETSGIPWRKVTTPWPYGTDPFDRPSVAATIEGATLADQVDLTRVSDLGAAWVSMDNMLVVETVDNIDTSQSGLVDFTIDEDDYSDIEIGFDTKAVVNTLYINYLDYDAVNDETTEVQYGPYTDELSVDEWGVVKAEVPYAQETFDAADIEQFAFNFLEVNRWPVVQPTSVRIPIRDTSTDKYNIDLFQLVRIKRAGKVDSRQRVTRVAHDITPYAWNMDLEFMREKAVQQVTY